MTLSISPGCWPHTSENQCVIVMPPQTTLVVNGQVCRPLQKPLNGIDLYQCGAQVVTGTPQTNRLSWQPASSLFKDRRYNLARLETSPGTTPDPFPTVIVLPSPQEQITWLLERNLFQEALHLLQFPEPVLVFNQINRPKLVADIVTKMIAARKWDEVQKLFEGYSEAMSLDAARILPDEPNEPLSWENLVAGGILVLKDEKSSQGVRKKLSSLIWKATSRVPDKSQDIIQMGNDRCSLRLDLIRTLVKRGLISEAKTYAGKMPQATERQKRYRAFAFNLTGLNPT